MSRVVQTFVQHSTCFIIALLIGCTASLAHATTSAVLIDRDLQAQRVRVTGLTNGRLHYFDAQRQLRTDAVDRFVQLRMIGSEQGPAAPTATLPLPAGPALVLADGQRLAGEWVGATDDGNAIVWAHPVLGEVSIDLDRLRGWRGDERQDKDNDADTAQTLRHGPPAQDHVVLTNGDALSGFITQVTETGVSLQQGENPEPIDLSRDRIATVVLANPVSVPGAEVTQPSNDRHRLVLVDGSVLDGNDLMVRSEQVRFQPTLREDEPMAVSLSDVQRIDFISAGRRLVALADCERQVSGGEVFGLPMGLSVETDGSTDGALRLHAPVTVTFELPAGAQRIAATAELASGPDAPAELTDWADFELVITANDQSQRYRLNGEQPTVSIRAATAAPALRIELLPGVNGPVLDRMRLRDAVVLVAEEGGGESRQ